MKKSIECSIVRDLLPSFIDHVTSSESNEIIQAVTNNFYLQQPIFGSSQVQCQ